MLQIKFEDLNRIPQKFERDKFFRVLKGRQLLATIYDIMMKPVHDVNLTKHLKDYLKTKSQARLSILILSKVDLKKGMKYSFS